MTVHVSVIIPTFNKAPLLCDILKDLERQVYKDFEVIVVDDGSVDDTIERLAAIDVKYPLHVFKTGMEDQFGMCRGYNIGIAHAQAPIILLLNDDVYLHPECIKHHMIAHKRTKARYVFVGPRFKCPPYVLGEKVTSKHLRRREYKKYTLEEGISGYPRYREKMMVSSNVSLSTRRLCKVGGYNENFTAYTGEIDREFYKRLTKARISVLFLWRAQAFSVRYGYPLYAQTKWVTDNDTRGGVDIAVWKHEQTRIAKKRHMLRRALENPPVKIDRVVTCGY